VLTEPKQLTTGGQRGVLAAIRPGIDGLIIQKGSRSALYLPQVWEEIPVKEDFLSSLCLKAGLHPDDWKDSSARFYTFQVESFAECRA
jgi:AMMECR1 domain-containing protein